MLHYYRDWDEYLSSVKKGEYNILKKNCAKWFLIIPKYKQFINDCIALYEYEVVFTKKISPFFALNHYFSFSEYEKFVSQFENLEQLLNNCNTIQFQKSVTKKYHKGQVLPVFDKTQLSKRILQLREIHNKEFIKKELRKNKIYFDYLLQYPLDEQQRNAIVKLEDNCLVISSAGSGKTSTSIAKVKYLLEIRHLAAEEILVLSYNRQTAREFQQRLNIEKVTCNTFHAVALSIIGDVEGARPDVCQDTLLLECYYKLVGKDEQFKKAVVNYTTNVASLTKIEHLYGYDSIAYFADRAKYGIMAPYGDMNGNPVFTRSEEERKICTWLTEHGVDFLYEQSYPINTANREHRQYKPDFTIFYTYNGQRYYVFLEHFGIDANGNVPPWFGNGKGGFQQANERYHRDMDWKQSVHRANDTRLLKTTSAMFHNGTIFDKLRFQLQHLGIPCTELTINEKHDKLIRRNSVMEKMIMELFSSFINLMKSNGKTFDSIMKTIEDSGQSGAFCERCRYLMFDVMKPLYEEYEKELKQNNQMDFTDLILHAAELCQKGLYKSPYSYIIVDEFQDISVDRYKFIQALRKSDPLTKTFCVGDDWQSIYRFSGSDMNLFSNFEHYFGYTEQCKIETTYRFGNPLIQISSKFVLQNPIQIPKTVRPFGDNISTQLSFVPFVRDPQDSYLLVIQNILNQIPSNESVMLLARYNHDVNIFPPNCRRQAPNTNRVSVTYANRTMEFMSVHAAKGLEADHILILNCSQDHGGFPSRISDDPILGYVLSEIDDYEYSEERRLFYVAITRAKKHVYILYNENMPSTFVTEMTHEDDDNPLCPMCQKGSLRPTSFTMVRDGRRYQRYRCTNSIAGCSYFRWECIDGAEQAF